MANNWNDALAGLRQSYPDATDGILFCVHKLRQDPTLTIKDFREEAAGHGIALGGRALHSARQLVGVAGSTGAKAGKRPRSSPNGQHRNGSPRGTGDLETNLIHVVQQIQEQATEESRRLREAMQKALAVLQDALKE